ncbi:MAG: RDD family protein [Candidatus Promineifilaceae bacterium]|jgi:uncharacterized RDD family membrane protein YckC
MSSSPIAPSNSSLQGQYAGFISRFIAILVDILLVSAVLLIVGVGINLILRFFRLDELFSSAISSLTQQYPSFADVLRILTALGSFYFIFFLYYITLHTATGGLTIGKVLMGLRVVRMDGEPLSMGRCTRRYFTFLLSAIPLFLGLLWVIIDDRRQGWHDKLSVTCVIYDWPAQEDENFLVRVKNRFRYAQETRNRYTGGSDSSAQENTG